MYGWTETDKRDVTLDKLTKVMHLSSSRAGGHDGNKKSYKMEQQKDSTIRLGWEGDGYPPFHGSDTTNLPCLLTQINN